MNKIDIILAIPLIWGAIIGFKKGLILELASLVGLILGMFGALKFSNLTAEKLNQYVEVSTEWIGLLSFLLTFVAIVIAVFLLAKVLDKMLKIIALGFVNRLLGLLFGLIKYGLILSVLLYFFMNLNEQFRFVEQDVFENSLLVKPIQLLMEPFSGLLENFEIDAVKEEVEEFTS